MPRILSHVGLRPLLFVLLLLAALAVHGTSHATDAAPKEGILLVAFGTSVPEAQPAFKAVDAEF